uniref:Uncharacterized protein n=1 Tax=Arundo donax TaxID=35708 RepID=A0A0A8XVZ5_ARUDO
MFRPLCAERERERESKESKQRRVSGLWKYWF